MADAVREHLEGLAKELSCSICLNVMVLPVGRLPCCHYFCHECISESIRHASKCPVCKCKATRRDVAQDATMDRVLKAFKHLQAHSDQIMASAGAVGEEPPNAIPWLQGVEDEAFRSPSKSLSGTALEKLRKRDNRSSSPQTIQKTSQPSPPDLARYEATSGPAFQAAPHAGASQPEASVPGRKRPQSGVVMHTIKKWLKRGNASRKVGGADKSKRDAQALDPDVDDVLYSVPETNEPGETGADKEGGGAAHDVPAFIEPGTLPSGSASLFETAREGGTEDVSLMKHGIDDILAGLEREGESPLSPVRPPMSEPDALVAEEDNNKNRKTTKKTTTAAQKSTIAARRGDKKRPTPAEAAVHTVNEKLQSSEKRRIPGRLLPWNCSLCTFENKGSSTACEMCATLRGGPVAPPAVPTMTVEELQKNAKPDSGSRKSSVAEGQSKPSKRATAGPGGGGTDAAKTNSKKARTEIAATIPPSTMERPWTKQPWVLLGSSLSLASREKLKSLAAASGATVVDVFSPQVTHVVCGAVGDEKENPNRHAKRTFKCLMGGLHGCWLVAEHWMDACLEAGCPVAESMYVIEGFSGCNGRRGDIAKIGEKRDRGNFLLKGFEVQLHVTQNATKTQMTELLKAAGAKVVTRQPTSGVCIENHRPVKGGLIIVDLPDGDDSVVAASKAGIAEESWYARALGAKVPVVTHRWAIESVTEFKASALEGFLV